MLFSLLKCWLLNGTKNGYRHESLSDVGARAKCLNFFTSIVEKLQHCWKVFSLHSTERVFSIDHADNKWWLNSDCYHSNNLTPEMKGKSHTLHIVHFRAVCMRTILLLYTAHKKLIICLLDRHFFFSQYRLLGVTCDGGEQRGFIGSWGLWF